MWVCITLSKKLILRISFRAFKRNEFRYIFLCWQMFLTMWRNNFNLLASLKCAGFGKVVQHLQRSWWSQCSCRMEPVCHLFFDTDGLQHRAPGLDSTCKYSVMLSLLNLIGIYCCSNGKMHTCLINLR